ncbi:MAG TPA: GNAT family N-acetyltransferase [Firmicutes bacterium]|nr:GNAT family N-acetyltransferase [Bacillales bacterium]HJA41725.1 GNAT family N-acetyltransferase [Bacillota bacterium]
MQWLVKSFDTLTSQELYEILALRSEIFIVEQNVPYQDLDGKDLDAIHIFAKDNGTVVAAIRILKPGVSYPEASFGRVVVKESYRGKKLSSIMIQKGLELMETKWNVKQVRISAQAYLQKYYATFGFEVQSEIYIEDQLPHIEMAKLH